MCLTTIQHNLCVNAEENEADQVKRRQDPDTWRMVWSAPGQARHSHVLVKVGCVFPSPSSVLRRPGPGRHQELPAESETSESDEEGASIGAHHPPFLHHCTPLSRPGGKYFIHMQRKIFHALLISTALSTYQPSEYQQIFNCLLLIFIYSDN